MGIDRFHKWRPINYSFVYVLIRPTSLILKEHFFCTLSVLTRLVGLISTKTKGYFFRPSLMQWTNIYGSYALKVLLHVCTNKMTAVTAVKREAVVQFLLVIRFAAFPCPPPSPPPFTDNSVLFFFF